VDSVGLSIAIFGVVCSTIIIHINNISTSPHRHHPLPPPLLILTPLTSALQPNTLTHIMSPSVSSGQKESTMARVLGAGMYNHCNTSILIARMLTIY
jgi:hypothetical protein